MITKDITKTSVIALNPDLKMRNDIDRIYIHPRNPFTNELTNSHAFIPPTEAIILALFDGNKTVAQVADELSVTIDVPREDAFTIITTCLKNLRHLLVEVDDTNRQTIVKYDPREFVIPADKIDLITTLPKVPEEIMFIPTLKCSLSCKYCYAPPYRRINEHMSFHHIDAFLNCIQQWNISTLIFSGGDPFEHPYITRIIDSCIEKRIQPLLSTKSTLSMEYIVQLRSKGIREIQISIDTLDEAITKYLTGRSNHPQAIINAIQNFIKLGISVYTHTVLTSYNIKTIPSLITSLVKMGIRKMTFTQYSRSMYRHQDSLFCSPNDCDWLEDQINTLKARYRNITLRFNKLLDHTFMKISDKEIFFRKRPMCQGGKRGIIILPNGNVTICETLYEQHSLVVGNITKHNLNEIWNSQQRSDILNQGHHLNSTGICQNCPEAEECYTTKGKCYVRALQAFNDIRQPDPYCPRSMGGRRIV